MLNRTVILCITEGLTCACHVGGVRVPAVVPSLALAGGGGLDSGEAVRGALAAAVSLESRAVEPGLTHCRGIRARTQRPGDQSNACPSNIWCKLNKK